MKNKVRLMSTVGHSIPCDSIFNAEGYELSVEIKSAGITEIMEVNCLVVYYDGKMTMKEIKPSLFTKPGDTMSLTFRCPIWEDLK